MRPRDSVVSLRRKSTRKCLNDHKAGDRSAMDAVSGETATGAAVTPSSS